MKLLKEGLDLRMLRKKEEAAKKFSHIIAINPNSVYAPKALYENVKCYFYVTRDDYIDIKLKKLLELINKYPESCEAKNYAVQGIATCYKRKKDYTGLQNAMQELINKYPNSEIATKAKNTLKIYSENIE